MYKIKRLILKLLSLSMVVMMVAGINPISTSASSDETKISVGCPVTVCEGGENQYLPSTNINDGDITTFWECADYTSNNLRWCQIDLGVPQDISRVTLYIRSSENSGERSSFQILASNDKDFNGYVVLGEQGEELFPEDSTWEIKVAESEPYRYVRFQQTKPAYLLVSELSVYSRGVRTSELLSLNKNVTVSSTSQSGYYVASNINDGDNATFWESDFLQSSTLQWCQIDLGTEADIDYVALYGRDNNLTERKNFEVRVSNDPNFGTYEVIGSQGDEAFEANTVWKSSIKATKPYRYVRLAQTASGYFLVAELSVYGQMTSAVELTGSYYTQNGVKTEFLKSSGVPGLTMYVKNTSNENQEVCAILVLKANNRLMELNVDKKTLSQGASEEITLKLDSIEKTLADKGIPLEDVEIKAYLIDNFGTLRPVRKPLKPMPLVTKEIYVSPNGNDEGNGTADDPYKTIKKAQSVARSAKKDGNIEIILSGGTYFQSETLEFDERDSGEDGGKVIYRSAIGEKPIISGGIPVKGWTKLNDGSNAWVASVEVPENIVRELYVDGKKAKLARTEKKIASEGFVKGTGADADKYVGILINKKDLGELIDTNIQDMMLHWNAAWSTYILKAESCESYNSTQYLIKPQSTGFNLITSESQNSIKENYKFYIENTKSLMDEQGEFYYNSKTSKLFYIPRDGENMNNIDVIIPVLETLVDIKGSDTEHKVHDLEFNGITFAHAVWNNPAKYGYRSVQAQFSKTGVDDEIIFTPANIKISFAENVDFTANTFFGLGGVGLGLYEDTADINIIGNMFYDIKDSAISLGMVTHDYISGRGYFYYNMAQGKPVTATSQHQPMFAPEKAVDAYEETGWMAAGWENASEQYIQVDLEDKCYFPEVQLLFADDGDGTSGMMTGSKVLLSNTSDFADYVELNQIEENVDATFLRSFMMGSRDEYGNLKSSNISPAIFYRYGGASGGFRYVRIYPNSNDSAPTRLNYIKVLDKSRRSLIEEGIPKNTSIINNYVTRVADYYWSSPAICGYYTENTEISNNHIENIPYSGISLGWGWDLAEDSTTAKNNKILNNRIIDVMKECYDGGAIYTLGQQPNSYICGNYINKSLLPYGSIYLDGGTTGYTVSDNVMDDTGAFFVSNPAHSSVGVNNVNNNYTSIDMYSLVTYTNSTSHTNIGNINTFAKYMPPSNAQAIIDNAGLGEYWKWLESAVSPTPKDYDAFGEEGYINVTNTIGLKGFYWHFLQYGIKTAKIALDKIDSGQVPYSFSSSDVEAYRAVYNAVIAKYPSADEASKYSVEVQYNDWLWLRNAYDTLYASRKEK